MPGLELATNLVTEKNVTNDFKKLSLSYGKNEGKFSSNFSGAASSGTSSDSFASRLEGALKAVRATSDEAGGGSGLPLPPLESQPLGLTSELITAADAGTGSADALFAFAVAQGLDPAVVASVLWPNGLEAAVAEAGQAVSLPSGDLAALVGEVALVRTAEAATSAVPLPGSVAAGAAPVGVEMSQEELAAATRLAAMMAGTPVTQGLAEIARAEARNPGGAVQGRGAASGPALELLAPPLNSQPLAGGVSRGTPQPSTHGLGFLSAIAAPGTPDGLAAALAFPTSSGAPVRAQSSQPQVSGAPTSQIGVTLESGAKGLDTEALLMSSTSNPEPNARSGAGGWQRGSSVGAAPSIDPLFGDSIAVRASALGAGQAVQPVPSGAAPTAGSGRWSDPAQNASGGAVGSMGPALASTLAGVGVGRADSLQFQQWINAVQGGRSATIDPSPGRGEQFSESSPGSSEWIPTSIESAGEVRHDAGLQAHRDSYRSTSAQAEVDLTAELEAAQAEGADESAREALRQRVSETVAQRMASQLTRGQMSLHLELKPADLGRVTIEMTLHNGRIEAVFDAATLSARTLISEGLDRLRHELERAGMNVAHLGLQSGSGGSSGGKPTPGRSDRRGDANGGELTVAGQEQVVSESASRRQRDRGLDLMV